MKIIYKTGNCLDGSEPWLLHGCNAQGVMGSGVAKAIRAACPEAYAVYKEVERRKGLQLGDISCALSKSGKTIYNGITQQYYGRGGKRYVDYDAIAEVIRKLDFLADDYHQQDVLEVAMPKLGAGLGGGDWDTIAEIIEQGSKHFQPIVYTL